MLLLPRRPQPQPPSALPAPPLADADVIAYLSLRAGPRYGDTRASFWLLFEGAPGFEQPEEALADALESGQLFGAGLDVFEGEPTINPRLLAAPGCILLPHIGSATVSTRLAMCELASRGVLAVLDGGQPDNLVPR